MGCSVVVPGALAAVGHSQFTGSLIHNILPLNVVMFVSEVLSSLLIGGFIGALWSLQYLLVARGTIAGIVKNTWGKVASNDLDQVAGAKMEGVVRQFVLSLYEIPGVQGAFIRLVLETTGVLGEPGIQRLLDEVSRQQGSAPIGLSRLITVSAEGAIAGRLEDLKYIAAFGLILWIAVIDALLAFVDTLI